MGQEKSNVNLIIKNVDTRYMEEHFEELVKTLYPQRQKKVLNYKNRNVAYTSVVAGLLMQEVFEKELGIKPKDIELVYGENGKPYLKGYHDFYFNISHSKTCVVMAYGREEIGVDVEVVGGKFNEKVAKKCFTLNEQAYVFMNHGDNTGKVLETMNSEIKMIMEKRFCKLWTMKESYLKLTGQGISIPLNSFEINMEQMCVENTDNCYQVMEYKDYFISVCKKNRFDNNILLTKGKI